MKLAKYLLIGSLLGTSILTYAQTSTPLSPQEVVNQFLADHEIESSMTYCRKDINTPECRFLIRYKEKSTGNLSKSFQIAFTAIARQSAGSEFFITKSNDDKYLRLVDSTMDNKVNVSLEDENQVVFMGKNYITLSQIKFGPFSGDLLFSKDSAELHGSANNQRVDISYPRMR